MPNILHITDFHIDSPADINENLRAAYYEEFIDKLVKCIHENSFTKIDYLILTGDFVNKGKLKNFSHANIVVDCIAQKLSIPTDRIGMCIGNHDYNMVLDTSDPIAARQEYYNFSAKYTFGDVKKKTDLYSISDVEGELFLLTLDSTLGSNGKNLPSELHDKSIDEINVNLDLVVPKGKPLLILSHYPMILFPRSQAIAEEDKWVTNHYWRSSYYLVERIYFKRETSFTMWFFGDGHIPDFSSYNNYHHFVMTGMIGGNYKVVNGNKITEVKLIEIDDSYNDIKIHTFTYKSKGYQFSAHTGYWEKLGTSGPRIVESTFKKSESIPDSNATNELSQLVDVKTKLVSSSVQDEIIDQIRSRKLYSFNRHVTSPTTVSIGWISITRLFEKRELLSRCIEKTVEWLEQKTGFPINSTDTIFIGIDFWGAIFASQASVLLNIENRCVATKSKGAYNIEHEKIDFLCKNIKKDNIKNIVLFTDVISTGGTIVDVKEQLQSIFPNPENINWIAVSIISDINQKRNIKFNDFNMLGTLCSDLRFPILNIDELPEESILPVKHNLL